MSRSLKSHKRFKHASPSLCVHLQHTDYHVLYTTSKFEAATTTTLNYILQPFTIFNPVFISILKLYTFHTMDNRKHFFRQLFSSTLFSLPSPSPSCYRPTCLRSLTFLAYAFPPPLTTKQLQEYTVNAYYLLKHCLLLCLYGLLPR